VISLQEVHVRTKRSPFIVVLFVTLSLSAPILAHHGTASFDTDKDVILKGTVTEWVWSNPHCFLKFDVKGDDGTVKNWAVETQNPTDMTKRGWARNSFKAGDEVVVTLQAVKNGAPIGRIRSVLLPSGQTLVAMAPAAPPAEGVK
jgi:hypothetical protein